MLLIADHILHLEPLEVPAEPGLIERRLLGTIAHEALERFYLNGDETVFETVLRQYDTNPPGGYPLLWDIWKNRLRDVLIRFVTWEDQHRDGWKPAFMEVSGAGPLAELGSEAASLLFKGTIDRLDLTTSEGQWLFRIIDYKLKRRLPKSLALETIRAKQLQPALYAAIGRAVLQDKMQKGELATKSVAWAGSSLINLFDQNEEGDFATVELTADFFEQGGAVPLAATLHHLFKLVQQGQFFIHRNDLCSTCAYSTLCRKEHMPTRWRVEDSPIYKRHVALVEESTMPKKSSPLVGEGRVRGR